MKRDEKQYMKNYVLLQVRDGLFFVVLSVLINILMRVFGWFKMETISELHDQYLRTGRPIKVNSGAWVGNLACEPIPRNLVSSKKCPQCREFLLLLPESSIMGCSDEYYECPVCGWQDGGIK